MKSVVGLVTTLCKCRETIKCVGREVGKQGNLIYVLLVGICKQLSAADSGRKCLTNAEGD